MLVVTFVVSVYAMDVEKTYEEEPKWSLCSSTCKSFVAGLALEVVGSGIASIPYALAFFSDQSEQTALNVAVSESVCTTMSLLYFFPEPLTYMPQMMGVLGGTMLFGLPESPIEMLQAGYTAVRMNQLVSLILYGVGTAYAWLYHSHFNSGDAEHYRFINLATTFTAALFYAISSSPIGLWAIKRYKNRQ